jgi:hypothetical protein
MAAAIKKRKRKIQLIKFMGDSGRKNPEATSTLDVKIPAQSWRLAEFPSW